MLTSPACPSSSAVMAYSGMTISTLCLVPCVHPRFPRRAGTIRPLRYGHSARWYKRGTSGCGHTTATTAAATSAVSFCGWSCWAVSHVKCPHRHPHVRGPGTAVPVVSVPCRVDLVMVLWTVRMALMRRAVRPFMEGPLAESIPQPGPKPSPPLSLESFRPSPGRFRQTWSTSSPIRSYPYLVQSNPCRQ